MFCSNSVPPFICLRKLSETVKTFANEMLRTGILLSFSVEYSKEGSQGSQTDFVISDLFLAPYMFPGTLLVFLCFFTFFFKWMNVVDEFNIFVNLKMGTRIIKFQGYCDRGTLYNATNSYNSLTK